MGGLVREAIDARFGGISRAERIRAVEEIASMEGGRTLSPNALDRLIHEERETLLDQVKRPEQ